MAPKKTAKDKPSKPPVPEGDDRLRITEKDIEGIKKRTGAKKVVVVNRRSDANADDSPATPANKPSTLSKKAADQASSDANDDDEVIQLDKNLEKNPDPVRSASNDPDSGEKAVTTSDKNVPDPAASGANVPDSAKKQKKNRGKPAKKPEPQPESESDTDSDAIPDDLLRYLANESDSDDDDSDDDDAEVDDSEVEELRLVGNRWYPENMYVRGKKLPNVADLDDSPAEGERGLLALTSWGYKSINEGASRAVQKLAKNIKHPRRFLNPRIEVNNKPRTLVGGKKTNSDAFWHQIFGYERKGKLACSHCQDDCGPFAECVQVNGSCANCRYGGSGRRCDFHEKNIKTRQTGTPVATTSRKRKAEEDLEIVAENVSAIIASIPKPHLKTLKRAIDAAINL